MRHKRTLFLIASERAARTLLNEGPGRGLIEVATIEPSRDSEAADYADRPGRSFESVDGTRHGMEPRTTLRESLRGDFARELGRHLAEAEQAGRFDQLVIAAAPAMLGALRQELTSAVAGRLHADLNKDLIHVTVHDLPKHLGDIVKL